MVAATDEKMLLTAVEYLAQTFIQPAANGTCTLYECNETKYSFDHNVIQLTHDQLATLYHDVLGLYPTLYDLYFETNVMDTNRRDQYLIEALIEQMGGSAVFAEGKSSVLYDKYIRKLNPDDYSKGMYIKDGKVYVPAPFLNSYLGTQYTEDQDLKAAAEEAKVTLQAQQEELNAQREEANTLVQQLQANVQENEALLREIEEEEERIQKEILKKTEELAEQMLPVLRDRAQELYYAGDISETQYHGFVETYYKYECDAAFDEKNALWTLCGTLAGAKEDLSISEKYDEALASIYDEAINGLEFRMYDNTYSTQNSIRSAKCEVMKGNEKVGKLTLEYGDAKDITSDEVERLKFNDDYTFLVLADGTVGRLRTFKDEETIQPIVGIHNKDYDAEVVTALLELLSRMATRKQ